MTHPQLYTSVPAFVTQYFESLPNAHLLFHSIAHTEAVVDRAQEIGQHYRLGDEDRQVLFVAAWFHDVGHLNGPMEGHEQRSMEVMRQFMHDQQLDDLPFVESIAGCILATAFPHHPEGQLQQIMCDADTYHLGTDKFRETNKQVKKELKLRGYTLPLDNWPASTLHLLKQHHFFTDYAQQKLNAGKAANMERIREKAAENDGGKKKGKQKAPEAVKPVQAPAEPPLNAKEAAKNATAIADKEAKRETSLVTRGIQTMLKLSSENHLKLSDLADHKANILISVNAIIISVTLSVLVRKLDAEPYLIVPTIFFLVSSVITIVLAILSTRPKVTEGKFRREDVINKETNLLFFGNFYRATRAEYEWAMDRLMRDREYIYTSLVRDIYYLGVVLGRKYKLLRLAYNIFMVGIVASVLAFVLATLLRTPDQTVIINNGSGSPV